VKKEEIEVLTKTIKGRFRQELETTTANLRNPQVVIYDIPEDITLENVANIVRTQNHDVELEEGIITSKFIKRTKRSAETWYWK
jgi:hypothetical protein